MLKKRTVRSELNVEGGVCEHRKLFNQSSFTDEVKSLKCINELELSA